MSVDGAAVCCAGLRWGVVDTVAWAVAAVFKHVQQTQPVTHLQSAAAAAAAAAAEREHRKTVRLVSDKAGGWVCRGHRLEVVVWKLFEAGSFKAADRPWHAGALRLHNASSLA